MCYLICSQFMMRRLKPNLKIYQKKLGNTMFQMNYFKKELIGKIGF